MSQYKSIRCILPITLLIILGFPTLAWSDISSSIIGTWKGPCYKLSRGKYIRSTAWYMSGRKYRDKTIFYKNAACTTLAGGVKKSKGTFRIGRKVRVPSGKTTYFIDYNITSNSYNTMRLPSVVIKTIVHLNGNILILGDLTPRTLGTRPSRLNLTVKARRQ